MSKRRLDHEDEEDYEVSYNRTIGSGKKATINASFTNEEEIENPTIITICKILHAIDTFKGLEDPYYLDYTRYKPRSEDLLIRYPENNEINQLKYTNQLIEIPIFIDEGDYSDFQLYHNKNFPFIREPMSIGTTLAGLMENRLKFKHFRRINIKNAKLRLINDSILVELVNNKREFMARCMICDEYGREIDALVTSQLLMASNILFERQNLWEMFFDLVENDEDISIFDKRLMINKFCSNLNKCFDLMEDIDLALTVNHDGTIVIENILHSYYTR